VNRLFILSALILFLAAPAGAEVEKALEEGRRAFDAGEYDKAMKTYNEALLEEPDSPRLFFNQANVYYRKKNFDKAAALYQKALLSDDPQLTGAAHYNLGNALFRLEQYAESIEHYKESLKLRPGNPDTQYNIEFARKKLEEQEKQKQRRKQDQKKEQRQQQQKRQQQQPSSGGEGSKKESSKSEPGTREEQKPDSEKAGEPSDKKEKGEEEDAKQEPGKKDGEREPRPDRDRQGGSPGERQKQEESSAPERAAPRAPEPEQQDKPGLQSGDLDKLDSKDSGDASETPTRQPVRPGELSEEEAERILNALEEKADSAYRAQLLEKEREHRKPPGLKDW
jgi:Ca-activated chloride channel family protein